MAEAPVDWRAELEVAGRRASRWLDVRIGPITDRWGALAGRLVVARDVTVQKELEDEDYFGSRAPVELTHSICPECTERLYPERREQPARKPRP